MITNHRVMCHLHSNRRNKNTFIMWFEIGSFFSFLTPLLKKHWILLTAALGAVVMKQINLTRPKSFRKLLNSAELNARTLDQIWTTTWRGGVPRFEAAVFRDAWICQRTPACYRLNSPFCLPVVLAHTSAVFFLSSTSGSRPANRLVLFIYNTCRFFFFFLSDHFPLCWLFRISHRWHCMFESLQNQVQEKYTSDGICALYNVSNTKKLSHLKKSFFRFFFFSFFHITADVRKR